MKIFQFFFIATLAGVLSCNKSVEPPNVNMYPFSAGNVWDYRADYALTNFRATQPGATLSETSYTWTATVRSMGDSILRDSVNTSRLSVIENLDGVTRGDNFYLLRNDSLCLYAWSGGNGSLILPKRSPKYSFLYHGNTFRNGLELCNEFAGRLYSTPTASVESVYYSSNPEPIFVFPLHVGMEWTVNPYFNLKKKVIGVESVPTGSGLFSAFVIQWIWQDNSDLIIKEYMSDKGLIKRSLIIKDIGVSSASAPDLMGIADIRIEYVLTSLNVP